MRVRSGDLVEVITGKYRTARGRVKEVLPKEDRVLVEGVNIIKRHMKRAAARQAGIIEREAPIHLSNVMPVCPSCNKAVRIGHKMEGEDKVRVCKNCGATLPGVIGKRVEETAQS